MKKANIADFKNHLSEFITEVENGEEIQVCRRNVPVAVLSPLKEHRRNQTKLGCGIGTAEIYADLTEPMIPEDSWAMLGDKFDNGTL